MDRAAWAKKVASLNLRGGGTRALSVAVGDCLQQTSSFSRSSAEDRCGGDSRVYMVVCVDQAGDTDRHQAKLQVVGHENDDEVSKAVLSIAPGLTALADKVVAATRRREEFTQKKDGLSQIDDMIKEIENLDLLSTEKTMSSWLKSPIDTVMRLCLGQVLAATFQEIGEEGLGCRGCVYEAGEKVLKARNKHLQSTACHSNTQLGRGKVERPNLQCFGRNGMAAMCQQCKEDWRDRNTLTQFYCAFVYSLMEGIMIDQVDIWSISEAGTRKPKRPVQEDKEEKLLITWPGSQLQLKRLSREGTKRLLRQLLLAVWNGGFWFLPHNKKFPKDFGLSSTPPPEFLTQQVYEFAVKQLELEKKNFSPEGSDVGNEVTNCSATSLFLQQLELEKNDRRPENSVVGNEVPGATKNQSKQSIWWTSFYEAEHLQAIWREPKKAGCIWIPLNAFETADVLGLSFDNLVQFQRPPGALESDKNGILTAEEIFNRTSIHKKLDAADLIFKKIVLSCYEWSNLERPQQTADHGSSCSSTVAMSTLAITSGTAISGANDDMLEEAISDVDGRCSDSGSLGDRATSPEDLNLIALDAFQKDFLDNPLKQPLVVVLKDVYVGYAHSHAQSTTRVGLPRQVFAVFSWHHGSIPEKKQPAIVFAVQTGSAAVTLEPAPLFFPQGHLSPEWWTVVNDDAGSSIAGASFGAGMFTKLGEQGVKKILACKSWLTKVKEADVLERIFGGSSSDPFAFWTISTDGLAAESSSFPSGLERTGTAVEYAIGVGGKAAPRLFADIEKESGSGVCGRWEAPCLERTERVWIQTGNCNVKAFQMEDPDCDSAFYVDLMNMETMKGRISEPGLPVSKLEAWVYICVIEVNFDAREWKLLHVAVPSWLRDVRFDENSKFIVLMVSAVESEDNYAVLSFVPKFGVQCGAPFLSKKGAVVNRSAIFRGALLKICAPKLWDKITTTSDHVRFRVTKTARAWLRSVSGFETVEKFCHKLGWLLPVAPGDGSCWIWAFLMGVRSIPCLCIPENSDPVRAKEITDDFIKLHQAVVDRARQMTAAVILCVHDFLVAQNGSDYDLEVLFPGSQGIAFRQKWKGIVARDEKDLDARCPGNYACDIELAALSFALSVDVHLVGKQHARGCKLLKDVGVKSFRRVMSKNVYLTVHDNFLDVTSSSRQVNSKALIELRDFVTFNKEAYAQEEGSSRNLGFFGLLGMDMNMSSESPELPWETMEEVVAKVMLDEAFGQARSNVFLVYQDYHYEAMIASSANPLFSEKIVTGSDGITERLTHSKKCSAALTNLIAVEMRVLVLNKQIKALSVLHRCFENDSLQSVCDSYKQWNQQLSLTALYDANKAVLRATESRLKTLRFSDGKLLEVPFSSSNVYEMLGDCSVLNTDHCIRRVISAVVTLQCSKTLKSVSHLVAHTLVFGGVRAVFSEFHTCISL